MSRGCNLQIGEIATLSSVSVDTIRYYTKILSRIISSFDRITNRCLLKIAAEIAEAGVHITARIGSCIAACFTCILIGVRSILPA